METVQQEIKDVPDNEVAGIVEGLQADPRYISHEVDDNGNGTSNITVVLKNE